MGQLSIHFRSNRGIATTSVRTGLAMTGNLERSDKHQFLEWLRKADKHIMEYLQANNFREKPQNNILNCFENVNKKDGVQRMDVYVHVKGVTKADAFTRFD